MAAQDIDPEIIEAWIYLGRAWFEKGFEYYNNGELDQAIENFSKAIELNPNNDTALNKKGLAYSAIGELDLAITDFDKAIAARKMSIRF